MFLAMCSWILLISAWPGGWGMQQSRPSAEVLMGAAQHQEDVEGNFQQAIDIYRKVAAAPDAPRALAARAQLRIGICYEKLGKPEARAAYDAVLRDYKDQKEVLQEAQKRLRALDAAPPRITGPRLRQISFKNKIDWVGPPSPDGRFLGVSEGNSTDVTVFDLKTGQTRRITHAEPGTLETLDAGMVWAPSGDRVAFSWFNKDQTIDLRVAGLSGTAPGIFMRNQRVVILSWMPDGNGILVFQAKTGSLSILSAQDGSLKQLKSLEGTKEIGSFMLSPDGRTIAYEISTTPGSALGIRLMPVTGGPEIPISVGEGNQTLAGWSPDSKSVYFTNSQSGTVDLWRIPVGSGAPKAVPVLVHRDMRGFIPLGYTRNGELFFSRTRNMQDVYLTAADLTSGKILSKPVRIDSSHVGQTAGPSWSPDGKRLAYYCGDFPEKYANAICIKSLENGSVREIKLKNPVGISFPLTWCCEGKEIHARGFKDGKSVVWRIDTDSGDWLGDAELKGSVIRYPYDQVSRIGGVLYRDAQGKETELYRGKPGESARFKAISEDKKWIAVELKPYALDPDGSLNTPTYSRLVALAVDGSAVHEVVKSVAPAIPEIIAFAPGNKSLLCAIGTEDPDLKELWNISIDGTRSVKLELAPAHLQAMVFHPDGK
jgi:Tol biopolymer transport system component